MRKSVGRGVFPDHHETIRVTIGERAQKHGIGNAENRRIRSDSRGKDRYGKKSKPRIFSEHAHGMPRILEQSFDKVYAPFITALLFELFNTSKRPCRGMPRFFGRHSSRNVFEDLIFQMEAQFLIE